MRLFSGIAGGLALTWGLVLIGACTSSLTLYPIPTDETDTGGGGAGGGVSESGRPDKCEGIDVSVGLIANFLFDGDTRDATGHGHDGTPEGDVLFITEGKHGQAILFSGTEARVTVPDDPALDTDDEFSLAAWVRPSAFSAAPGDNPAILAKWLNSPNEYDYLLNVQIGVKEGLAAFSVGDIERGAEDGIAPSSHVKHPWSIPVGAWTHVAATFNRGELRLFINGQLAAEKTSAIERTSPVEYAHDDVIIGNVFTDITHNYTWQGAIDDVRIYGPALSALQIGCLARQ
jgi:hypothetical protein